MRVDLNSRKWPRNRQRGEKCLVRQRAITTRPTHALCVGANERAARPKLRWMSPLTPRRVRGAKAPFGSEMVVEEESESALEEESEPGRGPDRKFFSLCLPFVSFFWRGREGERGSPRYDGKKTWVAG